MSIFILSRVLVTVDGVWIGNWIYLPYRTQLQATIALSLIHALYSLLQHALNLFSMLSLQSLSGNGFQRPNFLFPCSSPYWPATVCQLTKLLTSLNPSEITPLIFCLKHLGTDRSENTIPTVLLLLRHAAVARTALRTRVPS
jgi:hypothetical protein